MTENQKKTDNVVDIAAARRRSRTIAKKEKDDAKARPNGARRGNGKEPSSGPVGKSRVAAVIQLVIFLAALFYFVQLCRGPGG